MHLWREGGRWWSTGFGLISKSYKIIFECFPYTMSQPSFNAYRRDRMTSDRRFLQSKTDLLRSRPLWRRHSLKKNCLASEGMFEEGGIVKMSDLFGNHNLELGDRNRWEFWTDKVIHLLRAWFVTCRVGRRCRCFLFLHNSRGQVGKKGLWQESEGRSPRSRPMRA